MSNPDLPYKRILLKLSGEALMGEDQFGINAAFVSRISSEISQLHKLGIQLAIVIGGGNLVRGINIAQQGGDRVTGDHMGMLATMINALALKDSFTQAGLPVSVFSGIHAPQICEPFSQRAARKALDDNNIVLFAGGTGNPFFTTDTAATLRAAEMGCDVVFKATQVDGVYSADPKKDPMAKRYDRLSHDEAIARGLAVMDMAALALARDNKLSVVVFSIANVDALVEVARGKGYATVLYSEPT